MINNNIQEAYCSFEVSKLLKEKGCDLPAQLIHYYPPRKKDNVHLGPGWGRKYNYYVNQPKDGSERIHSFTHTLAIEWIRVNFGLTVRLTTYAFGWQYHIDHCPLPYPNYKGDGRYDCDSDFKTPQEATEAALLYTLKNLIP